MIHTQLVGCRREETRCARWACPPPPGGIYWSIGDNRMDSQLTKILASTRRGMEERKAASSTRALEQAAAAHQPRGFARALRQKAASGPAVIAELKKASPSRGLIRPDFDVASLAAGFADGGAAALSVLTEEHFFQGSLRNLEVASQSCDLPCLRKDFVVDEFQLLEARAHRADAILLIAAALSDLELRDSGSAGPCPGTGRTLRGAYRGRA